MKAVVLKFRVTSVEHTQEGDVLFTHAEAEERDAIRVRPPIESGSVVRIEFGANHIAEKRQAEEILAKREPQLGPNW